LVSQSDHAHWAITAYDNLEGEHVVFRDTAEADIQSKLAVARNAADEGSISEADLKLGLLAYPVLQAADIALYK
jgi:tryptophanyl-tRNA synthetase